MRPVHSEFPGQGKSVMVGNTGDLTGIGEGDRKPTPNVWHCWGALTSHLRVVLLTRRICGAPPLPSGIFRPP